MDQELWKRAKELYFSASDLETPARGAFLDRECEGNATLRQEVDRLLFADSSHGILSAPLVTRQLEGLAAGSRLGEFVIESQIGKGGGGLVYKAADKRLNRPAAIKILRDDTGDADRRKRFFREAEAASALNHPGIVTVYQIGTENGRDYIAMELIAGETLHRAIGNRPMPLAKMLRYAIQIADAVHCAHEAGIVHRDLKPGNVMITERGLVKVLDFGLAKAAPTAHAETAGLTKTGTLVGTFAYMAPEQADGKPAEKRSDIFSFGCILYEMLTGRRAFDAESEIRALAAVLSSEPRPVRELSPDTPRDIERLVTGCLKKEPRERWQDLGDVKILLETVLKDVEAGSLATDSPGARRPGRRLVLAAALAGAAAAGLAVWPWFRAPAKIRPEAAITMLTTDAGLSAYPALSRDGAILAYASDRAGEGNLDIWVQQIGGREPIQLTTWDSDETDPDIAPDGTQVVFRSERDGGGIYVVSTFGGEPILIVPRGKNPRFSPDGKLIAYWTGNEGPGYVADSAHAAVVPRGGGPARRLDDGMASALYPIWSPDGESVMVLGRKDAGGAAVADSVDWWMVPAQGGAPKRVNALNRLQSPIKNPPSQFSKQPLLWLAEPERVLFAGTLGDTTNVWEYALGTGKARRLTNGLAVETRAAIGIAGSKVRMAYSSLQLDLDIWALPMDIEAGKPAGELRRLTNESSVEKSPSLSWDGGLVAFLRQRSDAWTIQTLDLASGRFRQIAHSQDIIYNPIVSGDGSQVVYRGDGIMAAASRGGSTRTVCKDCGTATDAGFDASILLAEPSGGFHLTTVSGGRASELLSGQANLAKGRWSRDGKWIAFQAAPPLTGASNDIRIYVARLEAGRKIAPADWIGIAASGSADRSPVWSPGGNLLYFLSDRDGSTCIWGQRLEPATKKPAGEAFAVQHFHGARRSFKWLGGSVSNIGLSVGGKLAVFSLGELRGNIWLREEEP